MTRLRHTAALSPFRSPGRAFVFGHRGVRRAIEGEADSAGRGAPPENTLAAFEEAARQGTGGVELDVRLCGSGETVVFHDPTLERMTGGADRRAVADLDRAELGRIDLGGARIPLLTEVLDLAASVDIAVNVELKYDVPNRGALVASAARLLRPWRGLLPLIVSCFNPFMLAAFGVGAPGIPRALLVHRTGWEAMAADLARPLGFHAVHLEHVVASRSLVARLKARGLLVNVWTVNEPDEARELLSYGVDGLITDTPAAMVWL